MKSTYSISFRLTAWFCAVFLLGFVVFGTAMWWDLAYWLGQGRDKTLTNRAKRVLDLFESSRYDSPQVRIAKLDNLIQVMPEGSYVQIFDSTGNRIYPLSSAIVFPWPRVAATEDIHRRDIRYQGRPFRVFSRTAQIGTERVRIFIGGQLEDNHFLLARFAEALLWAIPVVLVLSALCGYFVGRRALAPLSRLIDSARSISIGNLSRRLPVARTGDELQKLAETSNDMLGRLEGAVNQITRFTADASHELRSPLSFIRTVAECELRRSDLDPETEAAFRDVVDESEQAARLLDDMLTLARSDAGHAQTVFETVSLSEVVRTAAERMRTIVEARGHVLTENVGREEMWITGDRSILHRLIRILLDNAIKYTPANGRIRISLSRSNGEAHLCVEDNGIGVPQQALPHIFDRFFRVDTSRTQEGTGLGLAIAKWIVEVHRAHIDVESKVGSGTTFTIVFPLAPAVEHIHHEKAL